MMKVYGFIYETTNLINGKKYIGKKVFDKNWDTYLGSGTLLKKAFVKYGKCNFRKEVLDTAYSREELIKKEILWIDLLDAVKNENYYNVCLGGEGGDWFSNISIIKQNEFREKCKNIRTGRIHSDETKNKISLGNKGKIISEETKKRMSNSGKENPKIGLRKPILQLTLNNDIIRKFDGAFETENYGFSQTKVISCCRKKRKTHKNYKWIYLKDYEKFGISFFNTL